MRFRRVRMVFLIVTTILFSGLFLWPYFVLGLAVEFEANLSSIRRLSVFRQERVVRLAVAKLHEGHRHAVYSMIALSADESPWLKRDIIEQLRMTNDVGQRIYIYVLLFNRYRENSWLADAYSDWSGCQNREIITPRFLLGSAIHLVDKGLAEELGAVFNFETNSVLPVDYVKRRLGVVQK